MNAHTLPKMQAHNEGLVGLASVLKMEAYKEERINRRLNSMVHVKGRANVLMKELFSPSSQAAVVIRRQDGTYLDPCDFGSYLKQMRN